jgi:hypothetical protein
MSYRTVTAVAAVAILGVMCVSDALARPAGGGRGGGAHAGNVNRGNVNRNVNRNVDVNVNRVGRPVAVGAAAAAGAAAAGAYYYNTCGYFPYPPCQ